MNKLARILMKADLSAWVDYNDLGFRKIAATDSFALGEVMYEAYKGTIDYEGETLEEARSEIIDTLRGKYGKVIENACLVTEENGFITSAVIFNWFEKENMPLLTFTMTRASHKGKGLAKKLLKSGLAALAKEGYKDCCLVVTDGNEPAVSIYKSLGFEVIKNV
ncbi:MAG: GNAT family N-acetyltransferase [Parachlamydiaceae bacterium]